MLNIPVMVASAEAGTYDAIKTALTSSATEIANSALGAIGSVVPVALTVMGAGVILTVAIKIFKKLTGK